jgi:hypothetical protein
MDRGVPTEAILQEMRAPERQTFYLVGTPKSRIQDATKELGRMTAQTLALKPS